MTWSDCSNRPARQMCAVCASLTISVYTLVPISQLATLLLGFPRGFFQSGIVAGMGATFAELFPTYIRATGQGFSYNLGRGVGSLMPTVVGLVGASVALNEAIGVCALFSYSLVLVAVALLPETRARVLTTYVQEAETVS